MDGNSSGSEAFSSPWAGAVNVAVVIWIIAGFGALALPGVQWELRFHGEEPLMFKIVDSLFVVLFVCIVQDRLEMVEIDELIITTTNG